MPAAAAQDFDWTFGPGAFTASEQAGRSIALLRDVVGPGRHALAIDAPFDIGGMSTGRVWVADASGSTEIEGSSVTAPGDELGFAVASVPDLDADGRDDFVVGAPGQTWPVRGGCGFRVPCGKTGSRLHGISGTLASMQLDGRLAGVGDVNGDGADDILAGAPKTGGSGGKGRVCLSEGLQATRLATLTGPPLLDAYGANAVAGRRLQFHR